MSAYSELKGEAFLVEMFLAQKQFKTTENQNGLISHHDEAILVKSCKWCCTWARVITWDVLVLRGCVGDKLVSAQHFYYYLTKL